MTKLRALAALGAVFALLTTAAPTQAANFNPPKHYYVALGDSLAFGMQFFKLFQELANNTYQASSFNTGYVDDFGARLQSIDPRIQTVNLSCPGETTASFFGTCLFRSFGLPLHTNYEGSQESEVLGFLHAHPGQVSPITIDIGLNDALLPCAGPTFIIDVSCLHQSMAPALQSVAVNLPKILGELHRASPSSEIIVLNNYNPFFVQDPSTDDLVLQLDNEITSIASSDNLRVADTFTPFNRTGDEGTTVCSLTLMCPALDVHPSDLGYSVIAQQVWAASGYVRLGD